MHWVNALNALDIAILNICHCFFKKHEALKTHISKPIETRRLKFKLFSDESGNWLSVRKYK